MMGDRLHKYYPKKSDLPCNKTSKSKTGSVLRITSVVLMVGLYFFSQTSLIAKVHSDANSSDVLQKPARPSSKSNAKATTVQSSSSASLPPIVVETNTNNVAVSAPGENAPLPSPWDGMAACLLIKDDNHLLIEWIAYHYLTLPLKYLVIAVDPDSFTSPLPIINRWNNSNDLDIEIMLWNDHDYMDKQHLATRFNQRLNAFQDASIKEEELIQLHRDRQARFVSQCSLYHKSKNRTWVAHFDTDEYIVFNYVHADDDTVHGVQPERRNPYRDRLPPVGEKTVLQVMKESQKGAQWKRRGCMAMIRLLFGPQEEPVTLGAVEGMDTQKFNTLRFYRHSQASAENKRINGIQKVLLDVSKSNDRFLDDFFSIHRPSLKACPAAYYLPDHYADSLFRVHHYLGSWEQYNARVDDRRHRSVFDHKAAVASAYGPNYDIQPWLEQFVRKVGVDRAKYLLDGVGEIEGNWDVAKKFHKDVDETACALVFFGIPRSFASTVFPTVKRHILAVNPSCDVFVHSYNVSNVMGNRMGEQSGNVDIEELHAFTAYYADKSPSCEMHLDTEDEFQTQRNVSYFRQFFPRPSAWEYPTSMDNMIRQWHSIDGGWNLVESYEKKTWRRFDRVGFFRLDVKYTHPINILTNETAVIPAMMYAQDKPTGINDRLFYGSRDVGAIWASDRFNTVDDYLSWQKENESKIRSKGLHSEEFLRYLLVEKWSIDVVMRNICFQRVRTSGMVLTTDCDAFGTRKRGQVSGSIEDGVLTTRAV